MTDNRTIKAGSEFFFVSGVGITCLAIVQALLLYWRSGIKLNGSTWHHTSFSKRAAILFQYYSLCRYIIHDFRHFTFHLALVVDSTMMTASCYLVVIHC